MVKNVVNITSIKKEQKKKMIAVISITVAILAFSVWHFFIEKPLKQAQKIPESSNIAYNTKNINPLVPNHVIDDIESKAGNPILFYIYTTWCSTCKRQTPVLNEVARKFQNTDLEVIAVAIDQNIKEEEFIDFLNNYKKIYFKPNYLVYSDGLVELLKKKSIKYDKRIPLTVLISRDGEIITRFVGYKSQKRLEKKIIKSLGNDN